MSDLERLAVAFRNGTLLRPSSDVPNIVDLARALAWLANVEGARRTPGATAIKGLVGSPEHLVFVLADGLGMNYIEAMEPFAFLRRNLATELRTVFPSTTPTVLTSIATGLWPNQHAVAGWHTYLPEAGCVSEIIKFARRSDEASLHTLGVTPEQAYPVPSQLGRSRRDTLFFLPADLADTSYSAYWSGGGRRQGYDKLRQAIDAIVQRVKQATRPTFTYLYVPHVDMMAHEHGVTAPQTLERLQAVNAELERLASSLPGRACLLVTADHGAIDVLPERVHFIQPDDRLVTYMTRHASGDGRMRYFSVRQDAADEFRRVFAQRFGGGFVLIGAVEAERLSLFGPGPLSQAARERIGDLVTISLGEELISYVPDSKPKKKLTRAAHGGLTPAEMRVPLVIT